MTDGLSPFDVKGVLGELAELGTVVVSCRTADFEQYLASYVAESVDFSSVWRLEPWRHNVEFANFIQILETRGVVKESELLEVVDSTPALQELVSCPLFARMLTLVGAQHASDVSDVTSLYRRFFEKLSVAADNALVEAGCHLPMTSMECKCSGSRWCGRHPWVAIEEEDQGLDGGDVVLAGGGQVAA
ncbi:MAG: hypothetical protein ACREX3_19135 [Gammaproteobacteria bacterium]